MGALPRRRTSLGRRNGRRRNSNHDSRAAMRRNSTSPSCDFSRLDAAISMTHSYSRDRSLSGPRIGARDRGSPRTTRARPRGTQRFRPFLGQSGQELTVRSSPPHRGRCRNPVLSVTPRRRRRWSHAASLHDRCDGRIPRSCGPGSTAARPRRGATGPCQSRRENRWPPRPTAKRHIRSPRSKGLRTRCPASRRRSRGPASASVR